MNKVYELELRAKAARGPVSCAETGETWGPSDEDEPQEWWPAAWYEMTDKGRTALGIMNAQREADATRQAKTEAEQWASKQAEEHATKVAQQRAKYGWLAGVSIFRGTSYEGTLLEWTVSLVKVAGFLLLCLAVIGAIVYLVLALFGNAPWWAAVIILLLLAILIFR
jgi:hypothetical protein